MDDWPPRFTFTTEGIAAIIILKLGGNAGKDEQIWIAEILDDIVKQAYDTGFEANQLTPH